METEDTKQENYQNQSVDRYEDKRNTIAGKSLNEPVETHPEEEVNIDIIEEEIENTAPVKHTSITSKIINFIQQNHAEIYWTPDKELRMDGKIIRGVASVQGLGLEIANFFGNDLRHQGRSRVAKNFLL
ncbi:hypothetical protein NPIL_598461 [Nephila pilipes]|uniref:Uncharacterized protein n=1 Tax=Nephila pilipes TaxID=299642 RepID=A0A8X6TI95_NEPPI|nr:hypothetical protein NPIL_598461 [Nephila pilipes]